MSQSRKIVRNYYRYLFTQGVHGRPNKCLHRHWEIQRFKNKNHKGVSSGEVQPR